MIKYVDAEGLAYFWEKITEGSSETWETYYDGTVTSSEKKSDVAELKSLNFAEGETWRVTWNGTEYVCETEYFNNWIWVIGNQQLGGVADTSGEPFLIGNIGSAFRCFTSADGTYTFKLEKLTRSASGGSSLNPLKGKIAAFTGDSICYGYGYAGGYAKIIGEQNNMTIQNIAVSGGTIVPVQDAFCISTSIANLRSDADYVIIDGGGNDANRTLPVGSLTVGYTDTLDTTTFAGAFENMLKAAIDRFHTAKIGYVFIHKGAGHFDSRDTSLTTSYYLVAKLACEKWGIPYCDLNTKTPALAYIDKLKTSYTYNGDGFHPNEQGYKLFYVPKITAWMKTL